METPPEKRLPRKVPPGPLTVRSRSLLRWGLAAGVEGKSVQARVAFSGCPAVTAKVKVRVSLLEPDGKAGASSFTHRVRTSPVKWSALSSRMRPQPWQLEGMAVAPVMEVAEFTRVARSSAAEGVKPLAGTAAPEG